MDEPSETARDIADTDTDPGLQELVTENTQLREAVDILSAGRAGDKQFIERILEQNSQLLQRCEKSNRLFQETVRDLQDMEKELRSTQAELEVTKKQLRLKEAQFEAFRLNLWREKDEREEQLKAITKRMKDLSSEVQAARRVTTDGSL